MKQLLAHIVVPLTFLLSSFFAYSVIAVSLAPGIESGTELISELEHAIESNPERAASCGLSFHLEAEKSLQDSQIQLLSSLRYLLIEGAFGLFLIASAWQVYVVKKLRSNS